MMIYYGVQKYKQARIEKKLKAGAQCPQCGEGKKIGVEELEGETVVECTCVKCGSRWRHTPAASS